VASYLAFGSGQHHDGRLKHVELKLAMRHITSIDGLCGPASLNQLRALLAVDFSTASKVRAIPLLIGILVVSPHSLKVGKGCPAGATRMVTVSLAAVRSKAV
jgi:hypothetical protein